jgi:hypothetical protein
MRATSAIVVQATFSLDDEDDELDEVLTVSPDFFSAGLSPEEPPFEPESPLLADETPFSLALAAGAAAAPLRLSVR